MITLCVVAVEGQQEWQQPTGDEGDYPRQRLGRNVVRSSDGIVRLPWKCVSSGLPGLFVWINPGVRSIQSQGGNSHRPRSHGAHSQRRASTCFSVSVSVPF